MHFSWQWANPSRIRFLLPRRVRYLMAWILAVTIAAFSFWHSWTKHDDPQRRDGNDGHAAIDFGGQYLMARMLARGQGKHLYNRNFQRQILQEVYLRESEDPNQESHDAESLMQWLMGEDHPQSFGSLLLPFAAAGKFDTVTLVACGRGYWQEPQLTEAMNSRGGPLYPPVHSLVFFPFGLVPPQLAYRINQCLNLAFAILAALAVPYLSRGRIWWAVAIALILIFPGLSGSMSLGQNAPLSLSIVMWGWVLIVADKPIWGGILWGLLAFKPTWALAFFLVPLLSRRWSVCLAMLGAGLVLAAATLPFVGWHSWIDWLYVGREATRTFEFDENWIHLSRDLLSIPRRWLDFKSSELDRQNNQTVAAIGWGILGVCLAVTLLMAFLARKQTRIASGLAPAFLFLGAWLSCFHFMYYDVLLAALPILLVLAEREALWRLTLRAGKLRLAWQLFGWVLGSLLFLTPLFEYLDPPNLPYDTFCLMAIWLWCGWYLLHRRLQLGASDALPSRLA